MTTVPEEDLKSTRAALEPTLRAAAEIIPLIANARQPRFPPDLAERWADACGRLAEAWHDRQGDAYSRLRPCIFELCAIAIELGDGDSLRLAEALASATDHMDDPQQADNPRLLAALSAACECLTEDGGLEHPLFAERTRYLAERLRQSTEEVDARGTTNVSAHFLDEVAEQIGAIEEALELLPPDAYAMKTAAGEIARLAEPLEFDLLADRAHLLASRLVSRPGEPLDLEDPFTRSDVETIVYLLKEALGQLAPGD